MKETKRGRILYVADLHRDGLIKVGSSTEGRLDKRLAELRRQFGPALEIFESAPIPEGWETPRAWETRLMAKILRLRDPKCRGEAVAFVPDTAWQSSTEVIKATRAEATAALRELMMLASCGSAMRPSSVREMKPPPRLCEVRPRKDRGFDLIRDGDTIEPLWCEQERVAMGYAKFRSESHDAVIHMYDEAGNVIETHEHADGLTTCTGVNGGMLFQYAKFRSPSHCAVIRVYDQAGVIETHEHKGDFKEW
jgi:hypothetical protein